MYRRNRQRAQEDMGRIAAQGEEAQRHHVPQPDLADSFRKAKAALEGATRDIVALRRRAGNLTRRSG